MILKWELELDKEIEITTIDEGKFVELRSSRMGSNVLINILGVPELIDVLKEILKQQKEGHEVNCQNI